MERTYERTHPWIKFTLNLRKFSADLWIELGECSSKCEHVAGVPLRPDLDRELHSVYLAKGVAATTAIEGNTLTEDQVREQVDRDIPSTTGADYQRQEVENIITACNNLLNEIGDGHIPPLSRSRIETLNLWVLDQLKLDNDRAVAGQIRDHSVGVDRARYRGAPAEDCAYLLDRLCDWLNGMNFPAVWGPVGAIIKAALAHLYLAWIHPFGDGNGRTARLVETQILLASGFPSPTAQLLSNHYNQTREEYYRQLDRASKSGGDVVEFIAYAVRGLREGLREQISRIRVLQHEIAWKDYVNEAFVAKKTEADHRRLRLVLTLSEVQNLPGVPVERLRDLSGPVARDYAVKTAKTLSRDLNELVKKRLIRMDGKVVLANRDLILAFLPTRAASTNTGVERR